MESLVRECLTASPWWWGTILTFLIGYAFSVAYGSLAIGRVIETIPRNDEGTTERDPSTKILGAVEAALYTTAWIVGRVEFYPIWLLLKVSSHWGKLSVDDRRPIFNRWLIATGLSLAFGIAGGVVITKGMACEVWPALLPAGLLAIGAEILARYAGGLKTQRRQVPPCVQPPILLAIATALLAWYARRLTRERR